MLNKYLLFIKQRGVLTFFYFVIRKLFFFFYKYSFKKCGSIFLSGYFQINGKKFINLGEKLSVGRNFRMDAIDSYLNDKYKPEIKIGNFVSFGDDVHIGCTNSVTIGNNVLFGSHVFITDHDHGVYGNSQNQTSPLIVPTLRPLTSSGTVIIEDNVFVGEFVFISKGSKIGKGSIIGANSVVNKEIPEFTIAVGNPAKIIKRYDFELNEWIKT